jgi:sulfur carrier protein ThiS
MKVIALGSLAELLGGREYKIAEASRPLAQVLRSLRTNDGRTLYDVVAEKGQIKPTYVVAVNGQDARTLQGLQTIVRDQETLTLVHIIPVPAGG